MNRYKDQVSWYVHLLLKPGKLSEFQSLTDEMVASTRKESGVLIYERFISNDGKEVFVFERYADSESAVAHLRAFKSMYGDRFSALVDRQSFHVFGIPNAVLRTMLREFGACFTNPFSGFARY